MSLRSAKDATPEAIEQLAKNNLDLMVERQALRQMLYQACALLQNADKNWSQADLEVGLDSQYLVACKEFNNEAIEFLDPERGRK